MKIKTVFANKPGYLKKGKKWLSNKFNITEEDVEKAKQDMKSKHTAKILLLDIETSPLKSYTWGLWNQNVSIEALASEWFMLTWVAKWYDDNTIYADVVTPAEVLNEDDSRITKNLHKLLQQAEIVITYNGDKFDIKRINTRCLLNNLPPIRTFHSIDLLKIVRKNFNFSSNKLDFVNKQLNLTRKIKHSGFELWKDCINGQEEALKQMKDYNIGDVLILEELYVKLRPWIKGHPDINKIEGNLCPTCGSHNTIIKTTFGKDYEYDIYECEDCGAISRNKKQTKVSKSNLTSIK